MGRLQTVMLKIASDEVGIREEGGENHGPRILQYMRATWMPDESNKAGYPWCAAFVCWVVTEAVRALQLPKKDYVYQGADAYGWEKFARKKGWHVLTRDEQALPGDLVIFEFSHIGIVVQDLGPNHYFHTIEGNTNGDGEREGDGVYKKERERVSARGNPLVKCFIRLPGG